MLWKRLLWKDYYYIKINDFIINIYLSKNILEY